MKHARQIVIEPIVSEEIGSELPEALETPAVVDRLQWVDINVATFRTLFDRVEHAFLAAQEGRPAVGQIGLGIMGLPMARHLAGKGFAVTGFDVDPAALRKARAAGAKIVKSPAEVAAARAARRGPGVKPVSAMPSGSRMRSRRTVSSGLPATREISTPSTSEPMW